MPEQQQGEKTEEPTPHKLREARKKGQVVKSRELTAAFLYIGAYLVLRSFAEPIWNRLVAFSSYVFRQIPTVTGIGNLPVTEVLFQAFLTFLLALAPIFLVVFAVAIVVESLQTGGNVSPEPLAPKLEKLNPIEGFKKIFSLKGLVNLVINLIKIGIVIWITWSVLKERYPMVVATVNNSLWRPMIFVGDTVFTIAMRIATFYVVVAVFDYFYQRFEYMKQMKMTKQEVKEEYKRLEGDPLIKRRMRQAQQEMAQSRSMANVPKSDVVVTNPTNYAIAIKYDLQEAKAPLVIAKGQRLQARKIRQIAEAHFIPVIENVNLAQALFKATEIGHEIPYELYRAVAEVLAFVYNLKKQRRGF